MNAVDGKKRCSRCKSVQAVEEFYRNSHSSDGLHTWCKKCVKENNNKNYDKDKWREYFLNNREHYENYANEYYEQNMLILVGIFIMMIWPIYMIYFLYKKNLRKK